MRDVPHPTLLLYPHSDPRADGASQDWDFAGEDTQYLTHGLHPYLASMIPQIPRRLLSAYAGPGTRVLDPFAGGGAVLLEASLAGLPSVGVDINPLAVLISRAKTTPLPHEILDAVPGRLGQAYEQAEAKVP